MKRHASVDEEQHPSTASCSWDQKIVSYNSHNNLLSRHRRRKSSLLDSFVLDEQDEMELEEDDLNFLNDRIMHFEDSPDDYVEFTAVELAFHSKYMDRLIYHQGMLGNIPLSTEISKEVFLHITQYCKNKKINLTDQNVYQIFLAADAFEIIQLMEECKVHIGQLIRQNPAHALRLWISCKHLCIPDLNEMAFGQILANFKEIITHDEFSQLKPADVTQILSNSALLCANEFEVYRGIEAWLIANKTRSTSSKFEVLSCLRVGVMTAEDRKTLAEKEQVKKCPEFVALLNKFEDDSVEAALRARLTVPRVPNELVLVLGGWRENDGPRSSAQMYNPVTNRWQLFTPEQSGPCDIGNIPRRVYSGCANFGSTIFLVGGYDGQDPLKSVLYFDLDNPECGWYEGSCMYEKRYYVACTVCKDCVYAIGGHTGDTQSGRLSSCEKLIVSENLWVPISQINKTRSDASAAVLDDKVYVAGGFDGRNYHDSAECYNSETDQWTLVARMAFKRGGICLVSHEEYLFAIGGNDGSRRILEIEKFYPNCGEWSNAGQLQKRKSNLSAVSVHNHILTIGGWSDETDQGILASCELFNPQTGTSIDAEPMSFAASATAACVLRGAHIIAPLLRNENTEWEQAFDLLTRSRLPLPTLSADQNSGDDANSNNSNTTAASFLYCAPNVPAHSLHPGDSITTSVGDI